MGNSGTEAEGVMLGEGEGVGVCVVDGVGVGAGVGVTDDEGVGVGLEVGVGDGVGVKSGIFSNRKACVLDSVRMGTKLTIPKVKSSL